MNTQQRAKRLALIIQLLFSQQDLRGSLKVVSRGARHLALGVRLANPLDLDKAIKLAEPLALHSGSHAVLAQRQEALVSYQFELAQGYWQYYTRQDVTGLELGLAENKKPVEFNFDVPHALVAGTSGSGKTETIKSALIALLNTYAPEELSLIICDPHSDYLDFINESHLMCQVATSQQGIKNALLLANNELSNRIARNARGEKILLVVIDEADKAIALGDEENLVIAQQLSQEGRKYKVYVLIGTQKPSHKTLPHVLDNLANRFIGLVTDAGLSARLTGQAGLDCHKLTGKGDFCHVSGAIVERFQVAQATVKDFDRLDRTEIKPVVVADFVDLPLELPEAPQGRPQVELSPEHLAYYFFFSPDKVTHKVAEEILGLKRTGHVLHRDFCKRFIEAYLKLRQSRMLGANNE